MVPASACASSLITAAPIAGIIAGLSVGANTLGVPTGNIATDLGSGFQSGSEFLKFLEVNCLNPAARAIYKKMLLQTEQSIFNWANNGFKGGPLDGNTFISDIEGYFGSVRDAAAETWIADQDKTNPFYDDIISAVYQNARNTNNGYTPDLAESIIAAECEAYQANQRTTAGNTRTSNSGNFLDSISSGIRSLFGGSDLPTNNPGFQNINFGNGGRDLFNLNPFSTNVAYAQNVPGYVPFDSSLPGLPGNDLTGIGASIDSQIDASAGTTTAASLAAGSPCNRSALTATEKQAIIAAYNAGQITVTPKNEWDIIAKSFSPNNCRDCVVRTAVLNQEANARNTEATEQTQLSLNNGNTGVRTCVSFLPRTEGQTDATCRSDGWRTVTAGSIVANQVTSALQVPLENVNKLTGQGTFADIAQSVLNGLINGLTNQLINSTNGLLSFSSKGGSSSQGEFTRGIATLTNTSTPTTDVQTSITRTSSYVAVLEENKNALSSIVENTEKARALCGQILPLVQAANSSRVFAEASTLNHRCNIDPLTINYKDDPTAGIKLSQNIIYKEVSNLDGTRGQRDQITISLQNAENTLSSLRQTQSKYVASTDANRESTFAGEVAALTVSIPGADAISLSSGQTDGLRSRSTTITNTVKELEAELAELK